jgi:hypothetical protein
MEDISLLKISSSFIIKQIFSNLDYTRFISLIKYSKKYQQKLEFNLKENIHYYKNIGKKEKIGVGSNDWGDGLRLLAAIPLFVPHYLYFIIHYILNSALTIKLNNNEKSNGFFWRIINGIIKKYSILIYIGSFYVLYHALDYSRSDYIDRKIIYVILLLLIMLFHACYEFLLIHKIKIISSFALNGKWMIVFDVIYLLANISYTFFTKKLFDQYMEAKAYPRYEYYNYLLLFKDIKIKKYEIPDNLESIENKRKYFESKVNDLEIEYSRNDLNLIESINNYRQKNNLNELIIDYKIPNFIIKESTEIILSASNIIKISNIKYLFRLNIEDDFEKIKEDENMINILLKPFLNKINIAQQGKIKYMTVYDDFDNKNYEIVQIKDKLENENLL